jgi:hypothetical protein
MYLGSSYEHHRPRRQKHVLDTRTLYLLISQALSFKFFINRILANHLIYVWRIHYVFFRELYLMKGLKNNTASRPQRSISNKRPQTDPPVIICWHVAKQIYTYVSTKQLLSNSKLCISILTSCISSILAFT